MFNLNVCAFTLLVLADATAAFAQQIDQRDAFYWLGEINNAAAVVDTDEGLLDKSLSPQIASGLAAVLEQGRQAGGKRPATVIAFEPLLIKAAGPEATLLHAGRSSQDLLSTVRAAELREEMLKLADQLTRTATALVKRAGQQVHTIVPNYTNGVAAQPNPTAMATIFSDRLPGLSAMRSVCSRLMRASTALRWARPC